MKAAALAGCVVLTWATDAQAGKHAITGQVTNRNNEGIGKALVILEPGNVEILTDKEGRFVIDYLREPTGDKVPLEKKQTYTITVLKLKYHGATFNIEYKRGELVVAPAITMYPETLSIHDLPQNVDTNANAQAEGVPRVPPRCCSYFLQ